MIMTMYDFVKIRDDKGQTPLHTIASKGSLDVLETLLEYGADVNVKDNEDKTPLHIAFWNGHKDIIEALLTNGAEVDTQISSYTMPTGCDENLRSEMLVLLENASQTKKPL